MVCHSRSRGSRPGPFLKYQLNVEFKGQAMLIYALAGQWKYLIAKLFPFPQRAFKSDESDSRAANLPRHVSGGGAARNTLPIH